MGGLLLFVAACTQLPGLVRIDVDGRTLELRQRGLSGVQLAGGWSTAASCVGEGRFDLSELGRSVVSIRIVAPDELEVIGPDGHAVRLFRCAS
jgi:hypothetical protein